MHVAWRSSLAAALVFTGLAPAAAGAERVLSQRNANYEIRVRLDEGARELEGRQRVQWRNIRQRPTNELWFHLYWNAWRNDRSTWMLEDRLAERSAHEHRPRPEDWGYLEIDTAELLGGEDDAAGRVDLRGAMRFASPDDGNPHDRTVLVVELPREVGPGESVTLEMTWRAKIPRTFARTGYRGDFYFLAHWFPKLGVYESGGWNCHQYHAATEYYSDYGVYEVSIDVPSRFVVGATGRERERLEGGDGRTTLVFTEADVHAFSWTASPDYLVVEDRFDAAGLPPVDLRLLLQPEHRDQAERHLAAAKAALRRYGTRYGPYPYGHLTIVDPAYGSHAGGMEYPTLFTSGTRLFNPPQGDQPESVTVHEAGHQFWYGLVGNNEFEHAWLDEGINTYAQIRAMGLEYGQPRLVRRYLLPPGATSRRAGFLPYVFEGIEKPRVVTRLDRYRRSATSDAPATPTFRHAPATAADITYSKTAMWLITLERYLGEKTLRAILSTFFERYAFRHPRPEDFFAVAEEVAGRDLSWFFDEVYRGSEAFDYAIAEATSVPAGPRGLVEREGRLVYVERDEDAGPFRTEVVVERRGGAVFPVEVLLVFEDGHEVRESWDGRARHRSIVVEHPARLHHAEVDPDRVLMLDLDYTNNSRLRVPRAAFPARKWAGKWMIWFQDLLTTFAFFV